MKNERAFKVYKKCALSDLQKKTQPKKDLSKVLLSLFQVFTCRSFPLEG